MRISLSAASINNKAPYPVRSENGHTFLFATRYGLTYEVGFVEDSMLSDDGLVFQIFIDNTDEKRAPADSDVYLTIVAILEEFFKNGNTAIVYICDCRDGRQAVRQRLFEIWFAAYPGNNQYCLLTKTLTAGGIPYYVSLLARTNMPLLQDRIATLNRLHQTLVGK